MSLVRFDRSVAKYLLLTGALLLLVTSNVALGQQSGPVYLTTGIYDEQTSTLPNNNMNAVDTLAAGNNILLDGPGGFKEHMLTAYANNAGGVVNFDLVAAASELTNRFFALYGQNNLFQQSFVRQDLPVMPPLANGGLNSNSNNGVISGANYLGISGNSNFNIIFGQPLIEFGITALSRGADRSGVMTIRYTDGSTPFVFPNELVLAAGDDTFFGHVAPVGKFINSVSWVSDVSNTSFVRWDDLGFSTSNLSPCDVNGSGGCDLVDYGIIRDHFLQAGQTRSTGDITGDGLVDLADFKLWKTLAPPGAAAGASVPEPSSILMVLCVLSGLQGFRSLRQR